MGLNREIIEVSTRGADKSKKQIKGVSGALGGLAKQALAASAAYFGGRALLNGIRESIDLFGKQELAEKKLEAALGRTSPALLKQARALQQVSMFGDEVIIEAQALIGSFVKEEDAIAAATKATLDLAAAKGMELTVAADLVSKTLGSSTNALSRYGIEVTGAVGSTERLESLTGNLADVFGGQATAQTDTFAGSMAQLSNAFGDLQERIGERLAPALGNLAKSFKDIITLDPSEEAIKERQEFEKLLDVVIDVESATSSRKLAIDELQTKYPDYLKNIDLEKTTTEDLVKFKKESLDLMNEEIVALVQREQLIELERERFNLQKQLLILDKEKADIITFNSGNQLNLSQIEKEAAQNRLQDIESEITLLEEVRKSYGKKTKEIIDGKKDEGEATKELGKLEKAVVLQGTESALKSAYAEAKANLIARIMKAVSFPFNIAAAAGAEALISSAFKSANIQEFATGADYITNGPEMIMVGDNPSGQERVQVTPLGGDPNINGPQGGMTINIQGSVIGTEQFTEDVLMPQIEEGLRLGNRI